MKKHITQEGKFDKARERRYPVCSFCRRYSLQKKYPTSSANGEIMTTERRRFIRPESLNLLDYLVVDDQGRQGEYSMGRTLNVSEGGILMETHIPLPIGQQVMITLGLEDTLVDVMGRILYATYDAGRHQNGIEFSSVAENDKQILDQYVDEFHKRYKEKETPGQQK
jgi:c-di-GMP-binding flagellar brake protein YcgR